MTSEPADWPFGDLEPGRYGAILADPPWHFTRYSEIVTSTRGKAPQDHYSTLSGDQIADLPVTALAAPHCVLFLWIVWPHLMTAVDVMKRWGFTYKTCGFAWVKADNRQPSFFVDETAADMGLGYWTRANSEVCLLATRGSPKRLNADVRQAIIAPRRQHSRKPDGIHERIERLVTGPYVELFARQRRAGWDCWGSETEMFNAVA